MLRIRLIKTKHFEDDEMEADQDSLKGVRIKTESLATQWAKHILVAFKHQIKKKIIQLCADQIPVLIDI